MENDFLIKLETLATRIRGLVRICQDLDLAYGAATNTEKTNIMVFPPFDFPGVGIEIPTKVVIIKYKEQMKKLEDELQSCINDIAEHRTV